MKDAVFASARLLELYDRISDAEDAIVRLRRFVLDLAVRGKLVEQDATDEPAAELLVRIAQVKAKLGMKRRPDVDDVTDLPFVLPRGWALSSIGEVCSKTGSGSTPRGGKEIYTDNGVPFLRSQNIYDDGLRLDDVALIPAEIHERMSGTAVKPADLLLNITGGSMGRCCRILDDFDEANVSQHVAIIRPAITDMSDFLHRLVLSPYFQAFIFGEQTGAGRGGLPKNRMDRIAVALPPLAEQHRIVAKVDELMALCDQLEQARAAREAVRDRLTTASLARLTAPDTDAESFQSHARFALQSFPALTTRPDQIKTLRQTILNLAVRGKLVEQDAADEPASELLKRIANERIAGKAPRKSKRKDLQDAEEAADNEPVPYGWVWARLRDVAIEMRYGTSVKCDYEIEGVPVLRIPNVSGGRISLDDMKLGPLSPKAVADLSLQAGDLLMIRSNGSLDIVGRAAVVIPEAFGMSFAGYLVRLRTDPSAIDPNYVWLAMNSSEVRDQIERPIRSAVGLKNVNLTEFGALAFRLPPLAEQHRIVAKVDALMAHFDRLEASLTTTATTRSKLLDALLHEALDPTKDELEAAE